MLQKPVLADDEEEETEEDDGQVIDLDGVNGKKLAVLGGALVFADALSGLLTGLRSEDPIVVPFLNENRGLSEPDYHGVGRTPRRANLVLSEQAAPLFLSRLQSRAVTTGRPRLSTSCLKMRRKSPPPRWESVSCGY